AVHDTSTHNEAQVVTYYLSSVLRHILFLTIRPPHTYPLFPYTTLFRSIRLRAVDDIDRWHGQPGIPRKILHQPHEFRRRAPRHRDRKSTRLNSSHVANSYAVFRLKKKMLTETYLSVASIAINRWSA